MASILTQSTPGLHGYAIKYSPFIAHRLACVCNQQYGIAGLGSLLFFDVTPNGLVLIKSFKWGDGLFDVTWSEKNANIAVTAAGDGTVLVWDMTQPQESGPVLVLKGHTKEVYGVDWSMTRDSADVALSASWDKTIKLWNMMDGRCLNTYTGHEHIVYTAVWSPLVPNCFASTSGDQTIRVWDVRKPYMSGIVVHGHEAEILTCDWSKYDQNVIASGACDNAIRLWDLRNPKQFLQELRGHEYAVRRLKFSPFERSVLLSCSYDFTVRTWNTAKQSTQLELFEHHTEFVYGIDFNLHIPGQVADCSFDETIKVYSPVSVQPQTK